MGGPLFPIVLVRKPAINKALLHQSKHWHFHSIYPSWSHSSLWVNAIMQVYHDGNSVFSIIKPSDSSKICTIIKRFRPAMLALSEEPGMGACFQRTSTLANINILCSVGETPPHRLSTLQTCTPQPDYWWVMSSVPSRCPPLPAIDGPAKQNQTFVFLKL